MRKQWALWVTIITIIAGCAMNESQSLAGPRAPEFIGGSGDWLNSPPLSLKEMLRTHKRPDGKPVNAILVDFWEYTCINCIRTMPYLREWNKRYADDGLLIVGIHTPEFQFAHDKSNVADAVKRFGLTYPILVDSDYKNWQAYGNEYWPHHYLIDSRGIIVEDHAGEGGYRETELAIQKLLKKANPSLTFPAPMSAVRDTDEEGAVCYPTTQETYVGYERGQLGNEGGYVRDAPALYTDPGRYEDGVPVASGQWTAKGEAMVHARTTVGPRDYIALRYHALDLYAVIKPETGTSYKVFVLEDGKPVPMSDKGADIRYEADGRSYLLIDTPRMYSVIHHAKFGTHTLKLSSESNGFGLYSYTFGSCTAS